MSQLIRNRSSKSTILLKMIGRSFHMIMVILLVHGTRGSMLVPRFYNATPVSGSTITGFEFQQNVTIVCRISEDDVIRETLWTISTAEDQTRDTGSGDSGSAMMSSGFGNLGPMDDMLQDEMLPESIINSSNDSRFSIGGEGGSVLVIDVFDPELNGSIVFCRDREDGDIGAMFLLSTTPINVVTRPKPGPIFAEVSSNVTILCDIQHENIDHQQWIVQGELLPDGGQGSFVITGPHQNTLTVVDFVGAPLEGIPILCQIALYPDIPIAQFSLHERRFYPAAIEGEEYENTSGECDITDADEIHQRLNEDLRNQISYFAVQKRLQYQ